MYHSIYKKSFHQINFFFFLKNRVTLKTGVMTSENSALHHRNKYIFKIEKTSFKHIFKKS